MGEGGQKKGMKQTGQKSPRICLAFYIQIILKLEVAASGHLLFNMVAVTQEADLLQIFLKDK